MDITRRVSYHFPSMEVAVEFEAGGSYSLRVARYNGYEEAVVDIVNPAEIQEFFKAVKQAAQEIAIAQEVTGD